MAWQETQGEERRGSRACGGQQEQQGEVRRGRRTAQGTGSCPRSAWGHTELVQGAGAGGKAGGAGESRRGRERAKGRGRSGEVGGEQDEQGESREHTELVR